MPKKIPQTNMQLKTFYIKMANNKRLNTMEIHFSSPYTHKEKMLNT